MQTLSTAPPRQMGFRPDAAASPAPARARAVYLNMTLWSLQGWLAMFFIAAGYTKLTEPAAILVELMGWPADVDLGVVRALGSLELGLAVLSLAPLASWRIGRPVLLACAAALLALEVAALALHALRGEAGLAVTNAVLIAITAPILRYRAVRPGGSLRARNR